jgi:hypothetical protein
MRNIVAGTVFPEKKFLDGKEGTVYMGKLIREMEVEELGSYFDPFLNFDPKLLFHNISIIQLLYWYVNIHKAQHRPKCSWKGNIKMKLQEVG